MTHQDADEDRRSQIVVLVFVAVLAAGLSWFIMDAQQPSDPSTRAATDAELECILNDQAPNDDCTEDAPGWAERPVLYSIALGVAILVIGRSYIFMRRMEDRRNN